MQPVLLFAAFSGPVGDPLPAAPIDFGAFNSYSRYVPPVVKTTTITYRPPIGHTHTCLNPNCPAHSDGYTEVWDHSKNSTHRCLECGRDQYLPDKTPQLVPMKSTSSVIVGPTTNPAPIVSSTVTSTYTFFPSGTGGCPNGICPPPPARYGPLGILRRP